MFEYIRRLIFGKKKDFAARVIERYQKNKPVSDFARSLSREDAATINARFARAKQAAISRNR